MRIVSLCPSLTELVFDLDRGSDLVGVTRFCVHPADEVRAIEKVGGTKTPKIERIVELHPDIVLLNREENRAEDAEALAMAGIPCHASLPKDTAETAEMVRSIGAALDRQEAAEALARDIEERSRRARETALGRLPVRFAYLIWRDPLMAVSGDTYISALLSLPGGQNVFADRPKRYPIIDPEDLVRAAADVVLLSTEPFPFDERHVDEISRATALAPEVFRVVDGELLSWHGSRTPAGIDYAVSVIDGVRPGARP
jgi:ABC-type Fe3+-hydroxamate transport system substrate-binding protein